MDLCLLICSLLHSLDVVRADQRVRDEQHLHSAQLVSRVHMAGPVKCSCGVLGEHREELLQRLDFLRGFGILMHCKSNDARLTSH